MYQSDYVSMKLDTLSLLLFLIRNSENPNQPNSREIGKCFVLIIHVSESDVIVVLHARRDETQRCVVVSFQHFPAHIQFYDAISFINFNHK